MDSILFWNDVALEANRVSHTNGQKEQTGPPLSARALAIVHLAMYDALAGVKNTPLTLPPYLGLTPPAASASLSAAIAAAAHATLSALFPSQKAYFDQKHQQANVQGPGIDEGHTFGTKVAVALLADRKDDKGASDEGYAASVARGRHRADPDNPEQGYHGPFFGKSKCFAVQTRHQLSSPPPLSSSEYTRALRQVRGRGIAPELMGTLPTSIPKRTIDQLLTGIYWGYDGAPGLGTPPRLYNQIVRDVAIAQLNDEEKNARLFAFVNAAMADAGVLAWEEKYRHDFWRPVVGIREYDGSMGWITTANNNISDDCDPGWLPLGAPSTNAMNKDLTPPSHDYPSQHARMGIAKNFTPPFPAYPSGHATFGAAAFHVTRLFYGVAPGNHAPDSLFNGLSFVSDEFNGISKDNKGAVRPRHSRSFPNGLWQMIVENGRSRVFLGVHWVFDAFSVDANDVPNFTAMVGGVPLGLKIAEDIFAFGAGNGPKKSTV
jgi:Vanadium chloroperoxidase N-terminal domain